MKTFKQAFLLLVGAVAVAYEEAAKAIEKQRGQIEKRFEKKPA